MYRGCCHEDVAKCVDVALVHYSEVVSTISLVEVVIFVLVRRLQIRFILVGGWIQRYGNV